MRYLSLALFAEGASDHGFLRRIIYRSVVEVGTRLSDQNLDVGERFVDGNRWASPDRAFRIREAFEELARQGAINLLFIHADGAGNPGAARAERISPAIDLLAPSNPEGFRCVAVIPVRETEAWALADPDALRAELGWNGDIGTVLPEHNLSRPDGLVDPKAILADCQRRVRGSVRRGRARLEAIPSGLGDRTSLEKLRRLPAFAEFENELERALRSMWSLES